MILNYIVTFKTTMMFYQINMSDSAHCFYFTLFSFISIFPGLCLKDFLDLIFLISLWERKFSEERLFAPYPIESLAWDLES